MTIVYDHCFVALCLNLFPGYWTKSSVKRSVGLVMTDYFLRSQIPLYFKAVEIQVANN